MSITRRTSSPLLHLPPKTRTHPIPCHACNASPERLLLPFVSSGENLSSSPPSPPVRANLCVVVALPSVSPIHPCVPVSLPSISPCYHCLASTRNSARAVEKLPCPVRLLWHPGRSQHLSLSPSLLSPLAPSIPASSSPSPLSPSSILSWWSPSPPSPPTITVDNKNDRT